MASRIPVWDVPVRLFHWALAVLVVSSYTTGKLGGNWLEWHMRSGYAILALLAFRFAWSVVGSETARFSTFLRGPRVAWDYARGLLSGRGEPAFGHNPLGGWMIVAMLAILVVQAVSGLFADDEIATQGPLAVKVSNAWVARMTRVHGFNQWLIAGAVALHVAAIAFYQWFLKVDLVGPMVHGSADVRVPRAPPAFVPGYRAAAIFAIACAAVYYLVFVFPKSPA
jgi:cytochrome b